MLHLTEMYGCAQYNPILVMPYAHNATSKCLTQLHGQQQDTDSGIYATKERLL